MEAKIKPVLMASPLARTTLSAAAFEQLIGYVVKGHWPSGTRIPPERELCQQFGIARTSLREALKAMELIGLLESRIGDGTFVCARTEFLSRPLLWALTGTDQLELRDIMEARMLIEKDLAGLAAERATKAEMEAIAATLADMRSAIGAGRSIIDIDMSFHLAVARAAHNVPMRDAVQLLRNLLKHWISLKLTIPDIPRLVLQQHEAIHAAIRGRKPTRARNAMFEHLSNTSRLLARIVEESVPKPPRRRAAG
jgi:GntR family transcriptional repressor for pyruvate dehydrogenase complex